MKTITRLGVGVGVALALAVPAAPALPAGAASTTTIAATGVFDQDPGGVCPHRNDYDSYLPIVMSGDLEGCWYTHIESSWDLGAPSGLYFEAGREVFVGRVHGGATGSFKANYVLESQWDPDVSTGNEVWGACQHQIVPGSGQAGLRGITGYLRFADIVNDGVLISYRVEGFARRS
jgi:hypothetical protein